MKLLLWDIDGTILCGGQAGERALIASMKDCFGITATLDAVDYRGRTDVRIAHMLCECYHLEPTQKNIHDFTEGYLTHLAKELPRSRHGRLLPGVLSILETVRQRSDIAQGLLTGNLSRGARLKLEHFNAWHYFEFGAFGDNTHHRNELAPHALQQAKEKTGADFLPENVFVIGDTPHDIACGRAIQAKTIAVATGAYSRDELAQHNPTALFSDFNDNNAFFAIVDGKTG